VQKNRQAWRKQCLIFLRKSSLENPSGSLYHTWNVSFKLSAIFSICEKKRSRWNRKTKNFFLMFFLHHRY
jgi:hypothetical protein